MENQSPSKPTTHSLIVLTYTRADLIQARISEITRLYHFRDGVELIVLDNGSEGIDMRMATMPAPGAEQMPFRVIRESKNLGFGGGWNRAVESAQGDILHLISDDVRIYGDFIQHIEKHIGDRPFWTGSGTGLVIGQTMIRAGGGWNEFAGTTIEYLMGHYLAMAREVWDELGGFDSDTFHPNDFEDVDLSYRASQAGFDLIEIPSLPIQHLIAGTLGYNPERHEHTVQMRAAFAKKWGLSNVPERP